MRVNTRKQQALSAELLRSILDYDPSTGVFTRKQPHKGTKHVGSPHHGGYLYVWVGKWQYLVHRLAWLWMTDEWPSKQIDHINGNRSDNRWVNLRLATHNQNRRNSSIHRNNTSGYAGVSFVKSWSVWHSYIQDNGKRVCLGFFKNKVDAALCRNLHAAYLYDDFSQLNRIGPNDWGHD